MQRVKSANKTAAVANNVDSKEEKEEERQRKRHPLQEWSLQPFQRWLHL